jgi:thioredoxin-like negative regulator of GroEL
MGTGSGLKKYGYQILLIIFITGSVFCQNKIKSAQQNQLSFEQKALERQLSYTAASEKRGETGAAYSSYLQMINKYETDPRVISGYINISVKVNKIKECEVKLKEIANKYPAGSGYIDPVIDKDVFPLIIKGFLAEFFIRTGRDDQAYQLFDQIDRSNTAKQFISEIKAYAFYRAGSDKNAEKIFLSLRKDQNNDKAYSYELYNIYLASNRVSKFINELFKMSEGFDEKNSRKKDLYGFNPTAELFRLFETESYKDSIMQAAEKLPRTERNSALLSELYFNNGSYEKAYEVLKNSGLNKNNDLLVSDFAVRLYSEKKYAEAVTFFELSVQTSKNQKNDDFISLYLKCLQSSGRIAKAVEVLKKSNLKDKNLLLAEIYHNSLDSLSEADRLYKNNLTKNKHHSEYWKDYIRLKIALKDFKSAKTLLQKVFDDQIIDIFTNVSFYEFRYMEALLALFERDLNAFNTKSDQMIRDDFISDFDNDLLKISSDIRAIGGDGKLRDIYLDALANRIDKNAKLSTVYNDQTDDTPDDKRLVITETNLYIFIRKNDVNKAAELIQEIIEKNIINNNIARMFADYSKEHRKEEKISNILLKLLQSGIGEEIKTEIREIIREKQPS